MTDVASPPDFEITEESFGDYTVLHMPNRLAERATKRVNSRSDREQDEVMRAEQALTNLSSEFIRWMEYETERLEDARAIQSEKRSAESIAGVFKVAHDIRGQASTLGFPIAGEIADGLCDLIERMGDHIPPQPLIDRHVESIRAIVRENVCDREHPVGAALADRLAVLRDAIAPRSVGKH